MFYILCFIIIIVLFILFFIQKKGNKLNEELQLKEKSSIDKLLILNIDIRKKILDKELLKKIESIIDKLRNILPILNESYKTSELTWVANKMATDYLQKIITPYTTFNKEEQLNKKSSLIESLEQIEKELDETIELVNEKNTSSFDMKAKFIKNRFK